MFEIKEKRSIKFKNGKIAEIKGINFSVSTHSNPMITSSTLDPRCAFERIKVTVSVDHKDWSPSHCLILLGITL